MKRSELNEIFVNKIIDASTQYLEKARNGLQGQSVFSFTIYCSSGCRDMGIALCTRSGLADRNSRLSTPTEPEWYAEVNSAEWDHINEYYELFSEVDEFINELYETFYEGSLDDIDLDDLDDDELWEFISNL